MTSGEAQRAGAVGVDLQVVAIQPVGEGPPGLGRHQGVRQRAAGTEHLALDEVDVEVAVVIEVEKGTARPHDLGRVVLPRHAVEVDEVEARRRRAVGEPRPAAGLACRRADGGDDRAGGQTRRCRAKKLPPDAAAPGSGSPVRFASRLRGRTPATATTTAMEA